MKNIALGCIGVLTLLCFCVGSFLCSLGFSSNAVSVSAPTPVNFVVLGDSIARGYGVGENYQSYAEIITTARNFNTQNLAVDGATTNDLLQLLSNNSVRTEIQNADIISISIGGNDILNGDMAVLSSVLVNWNLPDMPSLGVGPTVAKNTLRNYVDGIVTNFKLIMQQVKILNPTATIFAFNQYVPAVNYYGGDPVPQIRDTLNNMGLGAAAGMAYGNKIYDIARFAANYYNPILQEYNAQNGGFILINADEIMGNDFDNFNHEDFVHPNATGHAKLGLAILDIIINEMFPEPETPTDPVEGENSVEPNEGGDGEEPEIPTEPENPTNPETPIVNPPENETPQNNTNVTDEQNDRAKFGAWGVFLIVLGVMIPTIATFVYIFPRRRHTS